MSTSMSMSMPLCLRPIAVALTCLVAPAAAAEAAADEIALLRAQLEKIEARLGELEAAQRVASATATAEAKPMAAPEVAAGPGLEIDSGAGRSFEIGGRIHYDVYAHDTDQRAAAGGSEFRRARVNFDGAAAGWDYRLQLEVSGGIADLRDVYIERGLGGGTLTIGQFKPFRTMDELTSSNYLTVMERGFTSASGIFSDRQWQQGAGWSRGSASGSFGVSVFSLREDNTARNDGWGAALRSTYAPLLDRERLLHLGAWGSYEQGGERTPGVEISAAYGGRRGPSALLFESAADIGFGQRSFGLEFAGRLGSLYWQSEWSRAHLAGDVRDGRLEAKYLQASWLFGPASKKYDVEEGLFRGLDSVGEGQWEAVARVDYIRLRQSNNVEARRYVLGVNRYFSDDVRLMLNWVSGEDRLTNDEPEQLAMRLQYVF